MAKLVLRVRVGSDRIDSDQLGSDRGKGTKEKSFADSVALVFLSIIVKLEYF